MPGDQHTMDDKNFALCDYYRNLPDGSKAMAYDDICELVQLRDGEHPVKSAVFKAVACLPRLETWQPSSCWCVRARCVCVCVCATSFASTLHLYSRPVQSWWPTCLSKVQNFGKAKARRGRKKGWRKTSKDEDKHGA